MESSTLGVTYRRKENGVPVLSASVLDVLGERAARTVQPELFSGAIDRTDLKKVMGLLPNWHYAGRFLSQDGTLLGCAVFSGGTATVFDGTRTLPEKILLPDRTILVDRGLYAPPCEKMFRFTLAHEIGHALLHGPYCEDPANMERYREDEQDMLRDRAEKFALRDRRRLRTDRDFVEWQANAFAAALLLPKTLVYRTAALVREEGESSLAFANELCETLEDVFAVSRTAAFYRMKELELLPPSAVQLENGLISPQ